MKNLLQFQRYFQALIILVIFIPIVNNAQSSPSGIIIYKKPPGSHIQILEYSAIINENTGFTRIRLANGQIANLQTNGILGTFDFPQIGKNRDLNHIAGEIQLIESTIQQYPQVANQLNQLKNRWQNELNFVKQQQNATNPSSGNVVSVTQPPQSPDTTKKQTVDLKIPSPGTTTTVKRTELEVWDLLLSALSVGNLPEIMKIAQEGATSFPSDNSISKIIQDLQSINFAILEIRKAEKTIQQMQPEINRLLKNADVSDRPNPLSPNDNSGKMRAASDRRKAEDIKNQGEQMLQSGKDQLMSALETTQKTIRSFENSGILDGAVALVRFSNSLSAKEGLSLRSDTNESQMQSKILEAKSVFDKAESAYNRKEIREASGHLKIALEKFPGFRQALLLDNKTEKIIKDSIPLFVESQELKEKKKYSEAIERLEKIQQLSIDFKGVNDLLAELKNILSEKNSKLETAQIKESSGDLHAAYEIYDFYQSTEDIKRISKIIAERDEKKGDFLNAIIFYERAGLGEQAGLLREKAQEQELAYKHAEALLAEGKLNEALKIYDSYSDMEGRAKAFIQIGKLREEDGDFDTALALYQKAPSPIDMKRVQGLILERKKTLTEAKNKEASGDFEMAISLYEQCGAFLEQKRLAKQYAGQLEKQNRFAEAIEYYEISGDLQEARRIRESHSSEIAENVSQKKQDPSVIYAKNIPAIVTVLVKSFAGSGHGSGFFVKSGGWIVTNHHVVNGASEITIRLSNKEEYTAKVVMESEIPDFALLKVADLPFHPTIKLGESKSAKPGESVYAIGTPNDPKLAGTITAGIISNVDMSFRGNPVIQFDAAINHGNSGGPLFHSNGKVIGINTFGLGTAALLDNGVQIGSGVESINFAIQIDAIKPLLSKYIP